MNNRLAFIEQQPSVLAQWLTSLLSKLFGREYLRKVFLFLRRYYTQQISESIWIALISQSCTH